MLQNLVRAMTMKKGGVGYVQPGKGWFPLMADMNRFVLESDAIPSLAWLDGTTDCEKCIEAGARGQAWFTDICVNKPCLTPHPTPSTRRNQPLNFFQVLHEEHSLLS